MGKKLSLVQQMITGWITTVTVEFSDGHSSAPTDFDRRVIGQKSTSDRGRMRMNTGAEVETHSEVMVTFSRRACFGVTFLGATEVWMAVVPAP
jgi:hypothetical protein